MSVQASELTAAAEHIRADPTVVAVDIVSDGVELMTCGPVRPALLETVAAHGLAVDEVGDKAARTHRRVVVRPAAE